MDLDHARRKQMSFLLTGLIGYFGNAAANIGSHPICIPQELHRKAGEVLPQLDAKQFEAPISLPELVEQSLVTSLVTTLCSGHAIWGRLDSETFVVMGRILLVAESCLGKEQGLFQLMSVLEEDTARGSFHGNQSLRSFKVAIGEKLLLPLYFAFIDNSRQSKAQRWIGFLLCHLIKDNENNITIVKGFPSQWFKNLGRIVLQSNDRLLKTAAGKLIAEILVGLQIDDWPKQMKYFWPPGTVSYYMSFPEELGKEDWERRLFVFIDEVEKKQQMWEGTGFNATRITIGDSEIESECTLVSLTDVLNIYIPRQGNRRPQWIEFEVCNVDIVEIYSPYTQEEDSTGIEGEKLVDLQITLVDYHTKGSLYFEALQPFKEPDKIAFTVKDNESDQYADAIEKARNLSRISGGPATGGPLSDLELPYGFPKPQQDTQEALQKRREVITSMVDSPVIDRMVIGGKQQEAKKASLSGNGTKSNEQGVSLLSETSRRDDNIHLPSSTKNSIANYDINVLADTHDGLVKSGFHMKGVDGHTTCLVEELEIAATTAKQAKQVKKEAGISQHLKALKNEASYDHGKARQIQKIEQKHLYESDSEVSDLSEPPEGLESMFGLYDAEINTQRMTKIVIPPFKKPVKKLPADNRISSVEFGGDLKCTLVDTRKNRQFENQGVTDGSKQGVKQVSPKHNPRPEISTAEANVVTPNNNTTGTAKHKIEDKPTTIQSGLRDRGVKKTAPRGNHKGPVKKYLQKPLVKFTPQPARKIIPAVSKHMTTYPMIAAPKKETNKDQIDIFELPSDDEVHEILPVSAKTGKRAPARVIGKAKVTTKRPTSKPVVGNLALQAEGSSTNKKSTQPKKTEILPSALNVVTTIERCTAKNEAGLSTSGIGGTANGLLSTRKHPKRINEENKAGALFLGFDKEKAQNSNDETSKEGLPLQNMQGHRALDQGMRPTASVAFEAEAQVCSVGQTGTGVSVAEVVYPSAPKGQQNGIVPKQDKVDVYALALEKAIAAEDVVSKTETRAKLSTPIFITKGEVLPTPKPTTGKKIKQNEMNVADTATLSCARESDPWDFRRAQRLVTVIQPSEISSPQISPEPIGIEEGISYDKRPSVLEKGSVSGNIKGHSKTLEEPTNTSGRPTRAAAKLALMKLKVNHTASTRNSETVEDVGTLVKPREIAEAMRGIKVVSSIQQIQRPNSQEMVDIVALPDTTLGPKQIEPVAQQRCDGNLRSQITKPHEPSTAPEMLNDPSGTTELEAIVCGDRVNNLGLMPSLVGIDGVQAIKRESIHKVVEVNTQVEKNATDKGARVYTTPTKHGEDAWNNHPVCKNFHISQVASEKPICETAWGNRKRIVPSQATYPITSLDHVSLQQPKETRFTGLRTGIPSIKTKQQTLDRKTPKTPLDCMLDRKPQIISWGKQGPLNQGRLIDTSGSRNHGACNVEYDIDESPSQRVITNRHILATTTTTTVRNDAQTNVNNRNIVAIALEPPRHKFGLINDSLKPSPRDSSPVVKEYLQAHVNDELQNSGIQVQLILSDTSEAEIRDRNQKLQAVEGQCQMPDLIANGRLYDMSQKTNKNIRESLFKMDSCSKPPSPQRFTPAEFDHDIESQYQAPKTPVGKRTDFWNEPDYVATQEIASKEGTDVGKFFKNHPQIGGKLQKGRMKQVVLSDANPSVLIKKCGKRIESVVMDDPFKVTLTMARPQPDGLLERFEHTDKCNALQDDGLDTKKQRPSKSKTQPPKKGNPVIGVSKHRLGARSTAALNNIEYSAVPADPVTLRANFEGRGNKLMTTKSVQKFASNVDRQYASDKTLANNKLPPYRCETESTSSTPFSKSDEDVSLDDEAGYYDKATVSEHAINYSMNPMNHWLSISFPEIGTLIEEEINSQETFARSLLSSFESSALGKVESLKRGRQAEFDDYKAQLSGPVRKRMKHVYGVTKLGLEEVVSLVERRRGKMKVSKSGINGNGSGRAQEIEKCCEDRWGKVVDMLRLLEKVC